MKFSKPEKHSRELITHLAEGGFYGLGVWAMNQTRSTRSKTPFRHLAAGITLGAFRYEFRIHTYDPS